MRILFAAAATVALASPAYAAPVEVYGGLRGGLDVNEGFGVGGFVGLDVPVSDKAFIGVALGLDDSPVKDCVTDVYVAGDTVCVAAGRDINAEARIGIRSGSSKLYLLGGYSNLALKPSASVGDVNVTVPSIKVNGMKVGAGLEYPISSKIFARIEYRYGNYSSGVSTHSFAPTIGFRF